MIFESQYHFANISATKARIFTKFKSYLHKIKGDHQIYFSKDPCTHTHARTVNARVYVLSHAHAFKARAHVCMHGS